MSSVLLIARRSLRQHALSTVVTAISTALGCGLVTAVFVLSAQSREAFQAGDLGFDAVLGPPGSPLNLVLNSVYHLETSTGNVDWHLYEELRDDPRVDLAVPYMVGDVYRGFRIVGTTGELFERYASRSGDALELYEGGRVFDEERAEAVVGSHVALRTGLRVGDEFHPSHGVGHSIGGNEHHHEYVVTGILRPTSTPLDKVVWIPIEGMMRMDGHTLHGTGEEYVAEPGVEIPEEHREVSCVMVKLNNPGAGMQLRGQFLRDRPEASFVFPIAQVSVQLIDKLGWVAKVLELVAWLVVLVAAAAILASLYNTMNERRRELAILRALGARRATVFSAVVLEAAVIAAIGSVLGLLVHVLVLTAAASVVREQTGVVIDVWAMHPALLRTPVGVVLLGALAGVLPAIKAYATDVARAL